MTNLFFTDSRFFTNFLGKTFCPFLLVCLSANILFAQKLDHHDLLLVSISKNTAGGFAISKPQYLSDFNKIGYNNQPNFFSSNEIYLTTQFQNDTNQTEIVSLDLARRSFSRVTRTAEAEYSPTLMPGGKRFSSVRVEADKSQRLWSFPLDRRDAGQPVFPKIKGVGYHCWLSDTLVAMFIVGENDLPHELVLAGTKGQKPLKIASNIGRSLHRLADGRLAFVQKATGTTWFIKTYDPQKKSYEILATTPSESEDFAVLPDGTFLMGQNSKLFALPPGHSTWLLIEDLSKYQVKKITRLAVGSSGQLAMVVN